MDPLTEAFNKANGTVDSNQLSDQLMQQAATEFAKPLPAIPTFGGVSLKAPKEELARAKQSREALIKTQEQSQATLLAAADASKRAADAKAIAEGDEAQANQARAQQEADNYDYFNKLFGIEQGGRIVQQAAQLHKAQDEAATRLASIKDKQSTGILDNPIEYILNQITLPSEIDTYNRTAQQIDMVQNNISTEIAEASNAGIANAKGISQITTAQAKAQVDKAKAIADGAKATIDEKVAKENVDFANRRLAADLSVASATREMTQQEFANASASYHSQITAIQLSQTQAERLLKSATIMDALTTRKAIDPILAQYDERLGNAKGTTTRVTFDRMNKERQYDVGAIAAGSFGANPFDAFVNIRNLGGLGPNASPATRSMYEFIQSRLAFYQRDPVIGKETDMKKKQELVSDKINTDVRSEVDKAGSATSIFHELSPKAMFGAGILQPDSPVGKIIEPLIQGPTAPSTDTIGYAFLTAASGNVNVAGQALADYYKKNMLLRNQVMEAKSFGVPLSTNYYVESRGAFGGKTYDLTNPAQATKWLLIANINDVRQQLNLQKPKVDDLGNKIQERGTPFVGVRGFGKSQYQGEQQ